MKTTLNYSAAALAAASATWSFAAGNFWPGGLAALAAALIVLSTLRNEETEE
ncbi:hypothetical protein J2Y69_002313 [Microbacterium resistens]|uniref:Uncharacterized protein n=1 Tax=Microbacterium resistens TaxID=156977 RepID=A0ABU1SDR0_9MICO|nr:hypothetical protein [Microbacterium resistens]MDR6867709.1 hypothetical protein [Microbacterium resistens]